MTATALLSALPHVQPSCPNTRLALFAVRRMGANGLSDARAAHAFLTNFGKGFRRPLTLTRALMADMAATSTMPIAIAPCCCSRMTASEQALLTILARVEHSPDAALLLMQDLLGHPRVDGVLASAAALAAAFTDAGAAIIA